MNDGKLVFDGGLLAGLRVIAQRIVVLALAVLGFNAIGWGTLALWPTSAYIYAAAAMGLLSWLALRTMTRMESVRRPRRPRIRVIDLREPRHQAAAPPRQERRLPQNRERRALHDRVTAIDAEAQRLSRELRRKGASRDEISATLFAFYQSGGRGDMTVERLVQDFRLTGRSSAAAVQELAGSYQNLLVDDDPDRGKVRHGGPRPRGV